LWPAAVLLFTGCATTPLPPAPADPEAVWQERQTELRSLERWRLNGRIALRSEERGWQAGIAWRQAGAEYAIRLTGPMGQGTLHLRGDGERLVVTTGDGESRIDGDAETLLYQELGMHVPISALRYWVIGLPAPELPATIELDDYGRLASLRQAEWRVTFPAYRPTGERQLPQKVFVTNHQASVRLVIDRWQPGSIDADL